MYENDRDFVRAPSNEDYDYMTEDGNFYLKSINKHDFEFLFDHVLVQYIEDAQANRNSLFVPYCGLYQYKTMYLLVTKNLLPPGVFPHQKFALKGFTEGREVMQTGDLA